MSGPQTQPTEATSGGGTSPAYTQGAPSPRVITPGVPVKAPAGGVYIPPPPPGGSKPYTGGSFIPDEAARYRGPRGRRPPGVWSGFDPRLQQQPQQSGIEQLLPLLLLTSALNQGRDRDDDSEPRVVYVQAPQTPVYTGQGPYLPAK